ncbi:TPA: invasin domain 3-containing protein, partial [Salmonella enterica subsp. enterica serovar Bahrenfeld]
MTAKSSTVTVGGSTVLTYRAQDAFGNPVSGLALSGTAVTGTAAAGTTVSAWQDQHDGTYTATLTAGHTAGEVQVMPQSGGAAAARAPAGVTVTPGGF